MSLCHAFRPGESERQSKGFYHLIKSCVGELCILRNTLELISLTFGLGVRIATTAAWSRTVVAYHHHHRHPHGASTTQRSTTAVPTPYKSAIMTMGCFGTAILLNGWKSLMRY